MAVEDNIPEGGTPPETETAAPPQPGPWAADAVEYFGDNPEAVASFDRYMREKQQPRITELEAHPGRALHADLSRDDTRDDTMKEIIEELYGPERVEQFFADATPAEVEAVVAEADAIPTWAKPLVERDQRDRDQEAQKAAEADYDAQLAGMREKHTDLTDADMELIHPFIAIATDTEEAYAAYDKFTTQFKARHGITPVEAAAEEEVVPAVLGTEGSTAAVPPVEKKYANLDEAFDDFFAEQHAAPKVL